VWNTEEANPSLGFAAGLRGLVPAMNEVSGSAQDERRSLAGCGKMATNIYFGQKMGNQRLRPHALASH
jgi:hypothetical protein